jgi:hypothetical protein
LDDVHVPTQPSDRLNVPEPLRPEVRPDLVTMTPSQLPTARVLPLALTV